MYVLHALITTSAATSSVCFTCPRTCINLRLGHRAGRIVKTGHTSRCQHSGLTGVAVIFGKRCLRALGDVPTRHRTEASCLEESDRLCNGGPYISPVLSYVCKRGAHEAHLRGRTRNGPGCWASTGRATGGRNSTGRLGAVKLLCRT